MHPQGRAWREMVKQGVLVLNYKGAQLSEGNIKETLGPKWAWKLGRLFAFVAFEIGVWQPEAVRTAIADHNFKVEARWLADGRDCARSCWWHVTELTLDHLRPSPAWQQEGRELELAKECEAAIRKGLRRLAEGKRAHAEQLRLLSEVTAEFQATALGGAR